jgi:lysosomal-associated transmembrane protein
MLVYGAIKCRPGYLMPFFCLQVFDFCVSCLTVVGYFSYIPDIKRWIAAQEYLPWKEALLAVDNDWLMLMAVMFFVLVLTLKAYFIGIVWSCYKYLSTYERTITRGVLRTYSGEQTGEDTEMLLPPKYEDVIAMPLEEEPEPVQEQPPPPPYSANAN